MLTKEGGGVRDFDLALSKGRIHVYIFGTFYVYLTCMYYHFEQYWVWSRDKCTNVMWYVTHIML